MNTIPSQRKENTHVHEQSETTTTATATGATTRGAQAC
jgi:hypothetical protein